MGIKNAVFTFKWAGMCEPVILKKVKYFKLRSIWTIIVLSALNELGKLYDMCQNDKEAEEFYNRALEIDKKHVKTHVNLCIMKFHQYKEEEALKGLRNLVKENPNDVNALQNLAKVLSLRGWDNEAMEIFLSHWNWNRTTHANKTCCTRSFWKIFSLEQSEAHFKKALTLIQTIQTITSLTATTFTGNSAMKS